MPSNTILAPKTPRIMPMLTDDFKVFSSNDPYEVGSKIECPVGEIDE